ncbi:hypothetical protein KLP28_04730 [Nocardioidaceae bacterium]|nr:hypothetical protein KLP28_04730 [Nocardioidaceae bacterium]
MTVVYWLLLVVHLVGLAGVLFGLLRQLKSEAKVIDAIILHSINTQLVAGLLLVGVLEGMDGEDVNHTKIGVKLAIALVLAVLAWANRKKPSIPEGLFYGFLVLEVLNTFVALFW